MTWHQVARAEQVPPGEGMQVCVDGETVGLYNIDGVFYATHDVCTHAMAHLSDGFVEGDCVECPLHAGVFHIPTGKPISGPVQKPVRIYPVKVENEVVFIQGAQD